MYGFIETTEKRVTEPSSVALKYNGIVVDEAIPEFETLGVTGRETVEFIHETHPMDFGSMIVSQRVDVEPLKVMYIIRAETDVEFENAYKKLMEILYTTKDVEISFADSDAVFFGRASKFGEQENINNQVVNVFEITRTTAHKYSEIKESAGLIDEVSGEFEVESIEIKPDASISGINIMNGEQTIRIVEPVSETDTLVLDFVENEILKNGKDFNWSLALDSDFENFEIKPQMHITTNEPSTILVRYRKRWL